MCLARSVIVPDVELDNIKDDAIAALQDVNFVPAICELTLMDPYNYSHVC